MPAQSQAINAYIDRLRASDPNGENKETQKLIEQAMLMIGLLTSMNGAGLKIQENQAKARSMQFTEFKKIIAAMGEFRGQLKYMAWSAAKDRNTAQSNLSSANLNVDQVTRLSDESRQHNAELYRQDLEGIKKERDEMLKGLEKQFMDPNSKMSSTEYAQQRSIIENKSNQATAEATLKYQQAQVDAAKREYDVKMKIVDLAQRGVDIQLDVAQSIGAPMETIVALERQRVQLAEDAYNAAHKQYQDLVNSGATQEEIEEAKLKMQKAQADVIKNQVGAQRSMMEKVFGNMIGSFGENAGIMGPNNLARKYGYGYGLGKDGTVTKGGKSTGGYRNRIFANNAMGNVTTVGLPKREGIGSSGAASTPGSGTSTGSQQPPVPKPGSGGPGVTGAGDKTKSDADFAKLGEKFASEKEGIEAAVFWEKKIYNVLVQDLVPGIKNIKVGGSGGSGTIDATYRSYRDPRARNPKVDANALKNNPGSRNSGIGTGAGFVHTGKATPNATSGKGNGSAVPGTGGKVKTGSTALPSVAVTDTPQTVPSKPGAKFKLKKGVTLGKNDYFDENTGIIYHGKNKKVRKTKNDDGTVSVDNASGYERTLADGSVLVAGETDANMSRIKRDAMVEKVVPIKSKEAEKTKSKEAEKTKPKPESKVAAPQKKTTATEGKKEPDKSNTIKTPMSPIQAGKQSKNLLQISSWSREMVNDYKQASPERKKKLLEELRSKYQQFNLADIKDGKVAEIARTQMNIANESFGNASGWFGRYKELSNTDFERAAYATNRLTNMLPTPAPAETSASAGTKPASTGAASQGNSGVGKTTIEVQVKFNNPMFEQQVVNICQKNAENIVKTGTGVGKK